MTYQFLQTLLPWIIRLTFTWWNKLEAILPFSTGRLPDRVKEWLIVLVEIRVQILPQFIIV